MRLYQLLAFLTAVLLLGACSNAPRKPTKEEAVFIRPSFKSEFGIQFTEVKRVFSNGLRFNSMGYELEPSWKLNFLHDDSIFLYNAKKKQWIDFHVYFDHDSILNMADTWLKLRKANKDSIVFQVLSVGSNRVISDEWSNVYMTFYSDSRLKTLSKQQLDRLVLPGPRDTAYIKKLAALAKQNDDKAFAAREPADMVSKSPLLTVQKVKLSDNRLNTAPKADEYLHPEYNIEIYKAYRNFDYSMSVIIDETGQIRFRKSLVAAYGADLEGDQERMMKGVVDGYLHAYLVAVPGTTLNIPHKSVVKLNIIGYQNSAPTAKK